MNPGDFLVSTDQDNRRLVIEIGDTRKWVQLTDTASEAETWRAVAAGLKVLAAITEREAERRETTEPT